MPKSAPPRTRRRTRALPMSASRPEAPAPGPASGSVALLIATRKGGFLLRSDRGRARWRLAGPFLLGNIIHHMVLDPRDHRTLLVAARTGHLGPTVFRSTDMGETWEEAEKPPAFPKAPEGQKGLSVHHVFYLSPGHASEPGVWYGGTSPQGLFRSQDGGRTWDGVPGFNQHPMRAAWAGSEQEGPPDGATLHSILIDPRDPNHMYFGMSGGGFFESTDHGADWKPLNKGCAADFLPIPDPEYGHDPHSVRLHPLNPDRLYQQNHCGIYRLDRPGDVWVRIGKNMPEEIGDAGFPMVLHPRDSDTAWVFPMDGASGWSRLPVAGHPAVYRTRDGGARWKRLDRGLPRAQAWYTVKRQAMTSDAHAPVGIYFGTTNGEVWSSLDEGDHWTCLLTHLPEVYALEAAELP